MKKRTLFNRDCISVKKERRTRGANAILSDLWRAVIWYYTFIKGIAVIRRISAISKTRATSAELHTSYPLSESRGVAVASSTNPSTCKRIWLNQHLGHVNSSMFLKISIHLRLRFDICNVTQWSTARTEKNEKDQRKWERERENERERERERERRGRDFGQILVFRISGSEGSLVGLLA